MVDQVVRISIYMFSYIYLGCQTLFVFDNSSNHSYYVKDTFLVGNRNLDPGKKQLILHNEFNHTTQKVQSIVFSNNYLNLSLRVKPKRIKQVLIKYNL